MNHLHYLHRCLQLARLGVQGAFPNPHVGAVIVYHGPNSVKGSSEQSVIIGEGYHKQYGSAHAEVMAVASVEDKSLLKDSTIYVSLEPCSYHGNTPPCTDLILTHKIPRVVIGCLDPNPQVAGSGVKRLRAQGVEVTFADDPSPFIDLNRRFFVNHYYKRPYITLKWAESQDGYIGGRDSEGTPTQVAITGSKVKAFVHRMRASHHAIMVGKTTAAIDDPSLTNRLYPGGNPTRIILDRKGVLPPSLRVFTDAQAPTIVLSEKETKSAFPHVKRHVMVPWPAPIEEILAFLYTDLRISSVLIEGGANLLQQVLDAGCYDEVVRLQGKGEIGQGVAGPVLPRDYAFDHHLMMDQDWVSMKKRVLSLS